MSSRWGLGFFSCILVVGMVGRGPVLFSRHSPCLHSWGMREDWSVVGRVFSSFSWLYGMGEHISVMERGFLAEEGGSGIIVCISCSGTGSFGSCCSSKLTSGAATEAGRSLMIAGRLRGVRRLLALVWLKVWLKLKI